MERYLAKLVFNIKIENGENNSQFDEQTWMIEASGMEAAFEKARIKGKREEISFLNENNKRVEWEFIDVCGLYLLDEDKGNGPLYSETHERNDASFYIELVRNKSMIIQTFFPTFV